MRRFVDRAPVPLVDGKDPDVRALWAWLAQLRDGELWAFNWINAATEAAARYRMLRITVRGTLKADVRAFFGGDDLSTFPGRPIRLLALSRKAGAQTDFLRVLVAHLVDVGFDLGTPGGQLAAAHVSNALLGIRPTANTVSRIWSEAKSDLSKFPPPASPLTSVLDR